MQAVNYIAPLVLVPYLTRILGVEKYGVLGLAITVSQYLILLTDFGFNFTASRKIAQFKDKSKSGLVKYFGLSSQQNF